MALAVRDVAEAAQWYQEVLGFEPRHEGMWDGVPTFLGKGTTALALFPSGKDSPGAENVRGRAGFLHLAFRADADNFSRAQEELKRRGIAFHFRDHEICHSIYFRDPDGHELEITTYDLK